jgi:hypothetical protein
MVVYLAWECSQMAVHVEGGIGLLVAIFGAVGVGGAAMTLGLWTGGR